MKKSILQLHESSSVQKTTPENTKYSRNKTILKIGYHAKAIAFLGHNFKFQKTSINRFCNYIKVVLSKKSLQKPPNIQDMRRF